MIKTASFEIITREQTRQQREEILQEHALKIYKDVCQAKKKTPRVVTAYNFSSDESQCYLISKDRAICRVNLITGWCEFL